MIAATCPPNADAAERFLRERFWLSAAPAESRLANITGGGGRVALVDADEQWTYEQLGLAANNVRALLASAGVVSGDSVLIIAPLRNAAVAAYHGAILQGAVAVLLDHRSGLKDIDNAITAASPRLVLAFREDCRNLAVESYLPSIFLDDIPGESAEHRPAPAGDLDPDAPAVVLFTSGTTSAPKGVIHTMNSLRCGARNMVTALGIDGGDAFYLASPLASITGVLQVESALAEHATVVLEDRFSATRALARISAHRATILGGAPFIAESILDEAARHAAGIPLRCIAVGGSMVPRSISAKATALGVRTVRVYGSSEAPFSTATPADDPDTVDDGQPMPGVEVSLASVDDELLVRGPHQFHGYLDPRHNADAFDHGWVRTGDRADIRDGRVRIKGRIKELVVRKGMKISLTEIDEAAAGLGECAAFALPDDTTGERLVLAVRCDASDTIAFTDVVDRLSATGLAKWKLPEQIVLWDEPLPRTNSGKIDRKALGDASRGRRTLFGVRLSREAPYVADSPGS